jgi:large subunit ribosomal protein L22
MEVKAQARFLRLSPRKARLVVDAVRGKRVEEALNQLRYLPQRSAKVLIKVVRSAVSNAEQNPGIDVDTLYVKKAFVDGGPSLKRWTPRAMGRATKILKRTCHITVVLDEK